jgi:Branched-chain amino acid aminotransferase/4-amino-4-deoxychorismate lyase
MKESYAEIKTPYTYYGGVKAQQAHVQNGKCDEVLFTTENNILEGTTFSFFAIKNNKVITPKAYGRILGSVTRKNLIRIMQEHQIDFIEEPISVEDINNFSEAFIASANRDIIPVVSIDNHIIGDGKVGLIYNRLISLYQKEILKNTI